MKRLCMKNICFATLILILCFSCFFVVSTIYQNNNLKNNLHAFADEENPEINVNQTGETLYKALLYIRDGIFYDDVSTAIPLKQNDFLDKEILNLSEMYINNIFGIAYFNLDNLKELYLQKNQIKNISLLSFLNLESLEILDLSNNKIESVEFGNLKNIQNLYLQNNNLSSINLTNIKNVTDSEGYINLENNKFSTMNNIHLPLEGTKYIDLYGNKIKDASIEENAYTPHKLNFIIQTLDADTEIDEKTELSIFPSYNGHNFKLKFTNKQTEEFQFVVYGNPQMLNVGTFKVEIYDNDDNLSEANIYASFDINVIKSAPTVSAYMHDTLIEPNTKIDAPITLKFHSEEGYTLYYSINGGEYSEGTEVTLNKNGSYYIFVKAQKGDITSKVLSIQVKVQMRENYFGNILIFILIIAAFSLLFIMLKSWLNDK